MGSLRIDSNCIACSKGSQEEGSNDTGSSDMAMGPR